MEFFGASGVGVSRNVPTLTFSVHIFDIILKQFSVKMNTNLSTYLMSLTAASLL